MSWLRSIQSAVRALKKDEQSLERELRAVRAKISELEQLSRREGNAPARRGPKPNRLSPEGRAAISQAAKKRWARYRSQKKKSTRRKR